MKRIEVHIKTEHTRPILNALKKVGVGGLTVAQVRGRGQTAVPAVRGLRGSAKFVADFNTRNLIYTIVNDDQTEKVVKAILEAVQNEEIEAFGKIFITNIEDAVDLATGKRGTNAI
jgi:nitrogen regulatory protein P-II 1